MSLAQAEIDPIRLGILWDRLISICDEIVEGLVRTSFSSIVRDGYDVSVVLFDQDARMFAQGTRSIPVFIGTAPAMIRNMLSKVPPDTLKPGDILITNDPIHGTGHLFDISVLRPVFRGQERVGYSMTITHLPDIGGMGFSASATESYHEGLFIPVCRLYDGGKLNSFILDLLRANVRTPEQVIGDVMANVGVSRRRRSAVRFVRYPPQSIATGSISRGRRGRWSLPWRSTSRTTVSSSTSPAPALASRPGSTFRCATAEPWRFMRSSARRHRPSRTTRERRCRSR